MKTVLHHSTPVFLFVHNYDEINQNNDIKNFTIMSHTICHIYQMLQKV